MKNRMHTIVHGIAKIVTINAANNK